MNLDLCNTRRHVLTELFLWVDLIRARQCSSKPHRRGLGDIARSGGVGQGAEILLKVLVSLAGEAVGSAC